MTLTHHVTLNLFTPRASQRYVVVASLLLALGNSIESPAAAASFHEMTTGCATDIGAGDGNNPWVIGCTSAGGGGYAIYYWDGTEWIHTNGAGTQISVYNGYTLWSSEINGDTFNYPAVINEYNELYYGIPQGNDIGSSAGQVVDWNQVPGCGLDVVPTVAPADEVTGNLWQPSAFVQNCEGGGETLYSPPVPNWGPPPLPPTISWATTLSEVATLSSAEGGFAVKALGPVAMNGPGINGTLQAWYINPSGNVCLWQSYACNQDTTNCSGVSTNYGNDAIAIASGGSTGQEFPNGQPIWVLDTNFVPEYLDQSTSTWTPVPGGPPFYRIDVGVNGTVWLIDFSDNIWYYN